MSKNEYGFICDECGGEVTDIWEQSSARGSQGAYRCADCGETGKWVCDLLDASRSGLSGCLVRREDYDA